MAPADHDPRIAAAVLTAVPVALTRCSADLRYLWVSERFASWLGRRAEDIVGKSIVEIIGPGAFATIRPHIEAVLAGTRVAYEAPVDYNPIGQRWIHAEYAPTFDASGAVDGWVACILDITARKQAEQGLAVAHGSLARLFELSIMPGGSDAMPLLLQAVVDTAIEITGSDMGNLQLVDEATGTLRIAAQRGFEGPFLEHFAEVKDGGAACGEAMRLQRQVIVEDVAKSRLFDKPTMKVMRAAGVGAVQSSPMVSRDGALLGMISTHWKQPQRPDAARLRTLEIVARQAADIIQQRRHEDQLREADRRKDEFLAMLGHELRNPLGSIVLSAQTMARRGVAGAEREVRIIDRQTKHLVRLVDDLLDVSRITQGKIELRKERVELAAAVAIAIEMTQPLMDQRSHELALDVAAGLVVDIDPERMAQVIANLLMNAASYTEPGGRIRVVAARRRSAVTLKVIDAGAGISAAMLSRVFEPFVQGEQPLDRPRGGLGLGLPIARSLVELHGGQLSAKSDGPGKGSEFAISLPLAPPASRRKPAPKRRRKDPERAARGSRILVVEDNKDGAAALETVLTDMGHEVRIALDGVAALRIAEAFGPRVAFIDIGLPGMDGYELAGHFRSRKSLANVRLIALTGYGQQSDRLRSADAGFEEHLVKPIDVDALSRAVEVR
jgi:PAS domain S-box-containing protein